MPFINAVRILVAILCVWSMYIMTKSYVKNHRNWNQKTIDYWYGRQVWTVVGLSACIEGLVRNSPFRYTFVFIVVAVIATLKGNLQKGKWGNDDKDYYDVE